MLILSLYNEIYFLPGWQENWNQQIKNKLHEIHSLFGKTFNFTVKGTGSLDKNVVLVMVDLRNKSWKPECVLSFNMDWRIKFPNIRQPMLKLKTHSSFHNLFRF